MPSKSINKYVIFLVIIFAIKVILMILNISFAFLGQYTANQPSNIWSLVWTKGLVGLWSLLSGVVSVLAGVIGIITKKENAMQVVLSIILLLSIIPGFLCLALAIGSHF